MFFYATISQGTTSEVDVVPEASPKKPSRAKSKSAADQRTSPSPPRDVSQATASSVAGSDMADTDGSAELPSQAEPSTPLAVVREEGIADAESSANVRENIADPVPATTVSKSPLSDKAPSALATVTPSALQAAEPKIAESSKDGDGDGVAAKKVAKTSARCTTDQVRSLVIDTDTKAVIF